MYSMALAALSFRARNARSFPTNAPPKPEKRLVRSESALDALDPPKRHMYVLGL